MSYEREKSSGLSRRQVFTPEGKDSDNDDDDDHAQRGSNPAERGPGHIQRGPSHAQRCT